MRYLPKVLQLLCCMCASVLSCLPPPALPSIIPLTLQSSLLSRASSHGWRMPMRHLRCSCRCVHSIHDTACRPSHVHAHTYCSPARTPIILLGAASQTVADDIKHPWGWQPAADGHVQCCVISCSADLMTAIESTPETCLCRCAHMLCCCSECSRMVARRRWI